MLMFIIGLIHYFFGIWIFCSWSHMHSRANSRCVHPMLMFNEKQLKDLKSQSDKFKYILCYCSTESSGNPNSINLTFKYILCYCSTNYVLCLKISLIYLNTSYVIVQHFNKVYAYIDAIEFKYIICYCSTTENKPFFIFIILS